MFVQCTDLSRVRPRYRTCPRCRVEVQRRHTPAAHHVRKPFMRITHLLGKGAVISLGATALTFNVLATPAHAQAPDGSARACLTAEGHDSADAARGGHAGLDHRDISLAQQKAIEART